MNKKWKFFEAISVVGLLALSLNFLIIFFISYIGEKPVTVPVDQYGEAHIEAVLFPIFFVIGLITWARIVRQARHLWQIKPEKKEFDF